MTAEMHVVAAQYAADARRRWHEAEEAYAHATATVGYWMMVDLRRSAAFREVAGSQRAYCRAEVFAGTVRNLASNYDGVELFKELGDGLLLKSNSLRDLVELICVLDYIKRSWRSSDARPLAPDFEYTCAVVHGECLGLHRTDPNHHESTDDRNGTPSVPVKDYLGSPIDRAARISGFKPSNADDLLMVIEADTAQVAGADLLRDYPFIMLDSAESLPVSLQKTNEKPVRVRRLRVDRARFDAERGSFARLRRQ